MLTIQKYGIAKNFPDYSICFILLCVKKLYFLTSSKNVFVMKQWDTCMMYGIKCHMHCSKPSVLPRNV